MHKYDWKVITAATNSGDPEKAAEAALNQLQDSGFEVFATHTLPSGPNWLVIIARKAKLDDKYDKRY
jgi:hypothetical protein